MKLLALAAAAFMFASVANVDGESLPQRDYGSDIQSLRRDVDLLLEANVKLESRLAKLESTSPAKPSEQPKQPVKPVAADTHNGPKSGASIYSTDTKPGHWTFPGDIASHLRTTHGKNVNGMTQEQMLNMHDALHEGEAKPVVQLQTCPVGQPCPQRQPVQQTYTQPRRTVFRRW